MSGNELLTDDELAAAFAEIEASCGDDIPDLDDGSGASKDGASSVVAVVNGNEPEFDALPYEGGDEFAAGGVIDDEFASPDAVAALQAGESGAKAPARRRLQLDFKAMLTQAHDGTYDLVDGSLNYLNRPLTRLDKRLRQVVVLASAVTIGLSILVILLAPLMIRGKTPMEFLHEKSNSLRAAVLDTEDSGDS